jgi:hypothetical protein
MKVSNFLVWEGRGEAKGRAAAVTRQESRGREQRANVRRIVLHRSRDGVVPEERAVFGHLLHQHLETRVGTDAARVAAEQAFDDDR